ncbi:hypothetical protein DUNSADRAFT_17637 [Dunaliella salina]|uniref:Uncharacterized protein n=1 Tax=Dunaliella salina TaxID=3046 RepID=A0ABQ7GZW8_DUNSA|nr:hypothetical protein DUNSADRAFT_17637 [Dunaliella salina]|eukprot:KAF5840153.1 hypothetical protein DUNSADRAFT_17637 [Dunaliella salina]
MVEDKGIATLAFYPDSSAARSSPGAEGVFQDPRKLKDIERLRDKIMERSPHAIVVGTSDPSSAQLHSDIVAVCDHLLDYNAQWTKELELQHVQVVQADERLAMLWERCKAAQDEFPEQPPFVRRAIALGRLQLDPLPVLAQLCGYRREVLSLHLSDMQDCLGVDERMRCIEELMVTAVSQVGADINLASNIGWRKDLLAFVPGLGPRKAQALLQAVARNGNKIESRNFMYKEISYVLGKVVFRSFTYSHTVLVNFLLWVRVWVCGCVGGRVQVCARAHV